MTSPSLRVLLVSFVVVLSVNAGADAESGSDKDLVAQDKTIKTIGQLGWLLSSWLGDQVSAGDELHRPAALLRDFEKISWERLQALLVPEYARVLPRRDGWNRDLDVYLCLDGDKWFTARAMLIRSAGRDGVFDGDYYEQGKFADSDFDRDIVWSTGYFLRWPERHGELQPRVPQPPPAPSAVPDPATTARTP